MVPQKLRTWLASFIEAQARAVRRHALLLDEIDNSKGIRSLGNLHRECFDKATGVVPGKRVGEALLSV